MLAAFSSTGNIFAWLPAAWACFWLLFFASLRACLEVKALLLSQVLPPSRP